MTTLLYFAYGSNLHPGRLQRRVPSARYLTIATLSGHQLRFHKKSRDGSGKCNIFPTANPEHRVIGIVYQLTVEEKPRLDRIEGLGKGYDAVTLTVIDDQNRPHRVYSYKAPPEHIDESLSPYDWYKGLVLAGSRFHQFPDDYHQAIQTVTSIADPNHLRNGDNMAILGALHLENP